MTNAYERTGLYPFNPFAKAWTNAINTIGQGQKPHGGANYEIFLNDEAPQLSESKVNQVSCMMA